MSEPAAPASRQLGRHRDRFVPGRMQERQPAGVQGDAGRKRRLRAVLGIADDRVPAAAQLHAQLVRPSGLRPQFQQGSTRRGRPCDGNAPAPVSRRVPPAKRRPRGRPLRPCGANLPASRPAAAIRPRRRPSRSSRLPLRGTARPAGRPPCWCGRTAARRRSAYPADERCRGRRCPACRTWSLR